MHPAFWRGNERWRADRLAHLTPAAREWARRGLREADAAQGYKAGNRLAGAVSVALRSCVTAYDEDEISSKAAACAHHCALSSRAEARAFAEGRGLTLPKGPNVTDAGIHARLKSSEFWRRQLRAQFGRRAECAFRDLGRVHRHADPYITDDGMRRHVQQQQRARAFLESQDVACKETGELFPLADIAGKSLASATIRRGEFMVRVRGFEEHAKAQGHSWEFYTLTAPSAYHPRLAASGAPNPAYQRSTVREARDVLQRLWARARAKAKRLGLDVYGFRIAEPHHDGTPHWHLLMFGPAVALAALWECIRGYWLSINREELTSDAAREARCKRIQADPRRGESAAGYVAKYVSKGIDGHALADDDASETDLPGSEAAARVVAWARLHGIRQFQQIGGPRVGVYRELRLLREPVAEPRIEAARQAADAGDFRAFWQRSGGIELDKDAPRAVDHAGRRVLKLTAWGEVPRERVVGVRCVGAMGRIVRECTRPFSWVRIRRPSRAPSELGPVAITVRNEGASNDRNTGRRARVRTETAGRVAGEAVAGRYTGTEKSGAEWCRSARDRRAAQDHSGDCRGSAHLDGARLAASAESCTGALQ